MNNLPQFILSTVFFTVLSFSVSASTQSNYELDKRTNTNTPKTIPEPNISVTPESLSAELITGETVTQTLTINNTGSSDLIFDIDIVGISMETLPLKIEQSLISERYGSAGLNVLLAIADDGASYITSELLLYPDISSINIFSLRDSTPTIDVLRGYDVVMAWTFDQYLDPVGFGDALADYVDQGGSVVLGAVSWYDSCGQFGLCGRIMGPSYAPLISASYGNHYSSANLQILNPTHPILENVTTASDEYRDYTFLTTGSRLIARWSDGENFVAVKGSVVALNSYVGDYYQFTGDIPLIVHNSLLYAAGRSGWLSANPINGIISAHSALNIDVIYDAGGLYAGDYQANLLIISNDPDEDTITVPVHLNITGIPNIFLSDTSFDFNSLFVGTSRRENLVVSNFGTDVLNINSITSDNTDYTVGIGNFSLDPGENQNVFLTFTPTEVGERIGTLTISSNDPDEEESTISLRGDGIAPPVVGVTPESLSIELFKGDTTNRIFTITNSGESNLIYNINIQDTGISKTLTLYPSIRGSSSSINKKNIKKNEIDTRIYPEKIQNAGGPDPFGYRWSDSDDPDGLQFNWIDVSLGASVNLKDDDYIAGVPLGFTFNYYGYEYTSVNIMSNGWLSFNDFENWYPYDVPSSDSFAGAIVPFGKDLFAPDAKYIRYQTFGTTPYRFFVVEYNTIPNFGGLDKKTFEVTFYEGTNNIIFQYLNTQDQPDAIGIESPDQTMGMGNAGTGDLFINPTSVKNNYAIEFSISPGWISVIPLSAIVLPDSVLNVNVAFNTKDFNLGSYNANILIHCNDPDKRIITIPTKIQIKDSLDGPFILTVSATNGSVIKNPDKPLYDKNELVELTAIGDTGFHFINWSGDTSGTANPINVVMNGNKNITASFAMNVYKIIATAGANGTISPSDTVNVNYGDSITFKMYPIYGYEVDSIWTDGIFTGSDSFYTFKNVIANHTIHVSFKQKMQVSIRWNDIPKVYSMQQNYPNPFNPVTVIWYSIPEESKVSLKIFDVLGQEIKTLVNKTQEAGNRNVEFDASALTSGMYFYRIEAISISDPSKFFIQVRKMILLR